MNKIKSFLRKWPALYRLLQDIYHGFRKLAEMHIFGTGIQEWCWKNQKLKWGQGCLSLESISHPHRQLLVEKIATHTPFNSILEIGCASGPNLVLLAKKFPQAKIIGIDINKGAVKLGNKLFVKEGISNVELLTGKADDLRQFQDKSFDIVFTDAVLMYIGPDKIKKVVLEMQRLVRKAVILTEYHSEEKSASGFYNRGNWLRDYKKLFQGFGSQIKTTKISPEIWGGDWCKLGYIIEIIR